MSDPVGRLEDRVVFSAWLQLCIKHKGKHMLKNRHLLKDAY